MTDLVRRLLRDPSGATAIEYALIAAILGVGALAAVNGVGTNVLALYQSILAGFGQT